MSVAFRLVSEETAICRTCAKEKPFKEFGLSKKAQSGHKSSCRVCESNRRRESERKKNLDYLMSREAPVQAAIRLIKEDPEALAMLIQRFRLPYTVYLQQERKALLDKFRLQAENTLKRIGIQPDPLSALHKDLEDAYRRNQGTNIL